MGTYKLYDKFDDSMLKKVNEFINKLKEKEIKFAVLETWRDPLVQKAYYAQGREDYDVVCKLREIAGLPIITEDEARRKITNTQFSKHTLGKAIDMVPILSTGIIPWKIKDASTAALWLSIGEIGESCGLIWGGRWEPKGLWGIGWDPAHYEV